MTWCAPDIDQIEARKKQNRLLRRRCISLATGELTDENEMSPNMPTTLYTATGIFEAGPSWHVVVSVPNFPSEDDAKAYAEAFRIRLVDGKLFRDDGKGVDIFDDTWRDVLGSQVALVPSSASAAQSSRVDVPIAQWESEQGFSSDFKPVAWETAPETL